MVGAERKHHLPNHPHACRIVKTASEVNAFMRKVGSSLTGQSDVGKGEDEGAGSMLYDSKLRQQLEIQLLCC
jgi:hypothetical protein